MNIGRQLRPDTGQRQESGGGGDTVRSLINLPFQAAISDGDQRCFHSDPPASCYSRRVIRGISQDGSPSSIGRIALTVCRRDRTFEPSISDAYFTTVEATLILRVRAGRPGRASFGLWQVSITKQASATDIVPRRHSFGCFGRPIVEVDRSANLCPRVFLDIRHERCVITVRSQV